MTITFGSTFLGCKKDEITTPERVTVKQDSTDIRDTVDVALKLKACFEIEERDRYVLFSGIYFFNCSENAEKYSWLVDGEVKGNYLDFHYEFTESGEHEVKLIVEASGQQKEVVQYINVDYSPDNLFVQEFDPPIEFSSIDSMAYSYNPGGWSGNYCVPMDSSALLRINLSGSLNNEGLYFSFNHWTSSSPSQSNPIGPETNFVTSVYLKGVREDRELNQIIPYRAGTERVRLQIGDLVVWDEYNLDNPVFPYVEVSGSQTQKELISSNLKRSKTQENVYYGMYYYNHYGWIELGLKDAQDSEPVKLLIHRVVLNRTKGNPIRIGQIENVIK